MKKFIYAFSAGLLAVGILSGCADDELNGGNGDKPSSGTLVNFILGGPNTRTVYDDEDEYQINWVDNDQVRIYCDQAEDVKQADYIIWNTGKVEGHEDDESYANLKYNENGLAWGGDGAHDFYAVYPADDSRVSVSNGVATFQVNQNQICTFGEPVEGNYMGTPDMSNAYMVAYHHANAPEDEVALQFKPIMTTLEITVRGLENSTENQPYTPVTGLTIFCRVNANDANYNQFKYNIANGEIQDYTPSTGESGSTYSTFVAVENGEDDVINLQAGESATFTVFLPPIDINAQNPITIRPSFDTNLSYTVTINGQQTTDGQVEFAASSKGKLTLPWVNPEEVHNNNWITPLDDNIYVQQLSIPGTHDAAAFSTTIANLGRTQGFDLGEQFDMGIRAFDMRAAMRKKIIGNNEMWLWHGVTRTSVSLDNAMQTFRQKLQDNPREFIILQFRHESEQLLGVEGKDPDAWNEIYDALVKYTDIIEPWRADLTIGDCRGKIVILTRDSYDGIDKAGLISGWPDNTSVLETNNLAYIDGATPYYVQDYYHYYAGNIFGDPTGSRKAELVENLLEVTQQFADPSSTYFQQKAWALNHTSGYATSLDPSEWFGTTDAYQSNAARVNPVIYRYLNNRTEFGPTGIVFMDWVGVYEASSYRVYGNLLPQAIINNNYRYTMLRKTGN